MAQRPSSRHVQPLSGPEKAFGEALREFRKSRGISQERLGLESGFDRTYISLIERGIQSPTLRTVFRLSEVLEVLPSTLIERTERELRGSKRKSARTT